MTYRQKRVAIQGRTTASIAPVIISAAVESNGTAGMKTHAIQHTNATTSSATASTAHATRNSSTLSRIDTTVKDHDAQLTRDVAIAVGTHECPSRSGPAGMILRDKRQFVTRHPPPDAHNPVDSLRIRLLVSQMAGIYAWGNGSQRSLHIPPT